MVSTGVILFCLVACGFCLLLGYVVGSTISFYKEKSEKDCKINYPEQPIVIEIVNKIYYDDELEEYVEEREEYKYNCSHLHRPHHHHLVSNFIGKSKKKPKK